MCIQMLVTRVVQTADNMAYCFDFHANLYKWRGVHKFDPTGMGPRLYRDHWEHVPEALGSEVRDNVDREIAAGRIVWKVGSN